MNIISELVKLSLNDKKYIVEADDISKSCGKYFSVEVKNLVSKENTTLFFPTNISLQDFIYEIDSIKYKGGF